MKVLSHTTLLIILVLLGLAGLDFLRFSLAVLRGGDAIFKVGVFHGFISHNGVFHFACSPNKPWHLAVCLHVAHHNVHTAAIAFNSLLVCRHRTMLWVFYARLPASSCRYWRNPAPYSFRLQAREEIPAMNSGASQGRQWAVWGGWTLGTASLRAVLSAP